jgi:glycerol uptake facilitator-like aquaporin
MKKLMEFLATCILMFLAGGAMALMILSNL